MRIFCGALQTQLEVYFAHKQKAGHGDWQTWLALENIPILMFFLNNINIVLFTIF